MLVPETAVDEDRLSTASKHNVWASRQVARVQPVTIAHPMNKASNHPFGGGVLAAHTRHSLASFPWGERVHVRVVSSASRIVKGVVAYPSFHDPSPSPHARQGRASRPVPDHPTVAGS